MESYYNMTLTPILDRKIHNLHKSRFLIDTLDSSAFPLDLVDEDMDYAVDTH